MIAGARRGASGGELAGSGVWRAGGKADTLPGSPPGGVGRRTHDEPIYTPLD